MATQQEVTTSSAQVATQVAANTGTGGGSAGNSTTGSGPGTVSSPTPVVGPKGFRSELQQMLQGWQEVIPSDSTVTSSGGSLTEAAVLAQLQGYLGAYAALDTHVTAVKQARAVVSSQLPAARAYFAVLKAAVANLFGDASPQLAQFGLAPKKARKPLSSQELAVRAAKAKATRALRGTKGPVKKLETKVGPMAFVDPVETTVPVSATAATPVASTAPVEPVVSAASPPAGK
jgi:hypothetical protein